MAKTKKRAARKQSFKSVKVKVKRKQMAKRAPKANGASRRAGKPVSAKREVLRAEETRPTPTETLVETTSVAAIDQPAPGAMIVEEVVVREENTSAAGGPDLIDQPKQKVA
jgi:hypothetical protein